MASVAAAGSDSAPAFVKSGPTTVVRAEPDRCPGALTLHQAADGLLARVRLPGGFADAAVLRGLAELATTFGDGRLELTSRGNVQLRTVRAEDQQRLAEQLAGLGLLPSPTHERVRNVISSPLAGLTRLPQLEQLAQELDRAICAEPELTRLSGRFLFALDDGSGSTDELGADITAHVLGAGRWLVAPGPFEVPASAVVPTMIALAKAFLAERAAEQSLAWRISELSDGAARVAARIDTRLADANQSESADSGRRPAGVVTQLDGRHALTVTNPLGRLSAAQATVLAELISGRRARITPWRSVVIPDVTDVEAALRSIEQAGLDCGADSVWNNLTACSGKPGCAKSLADVQHDAAEAALGRQHQGGPSNTQQGHSRRLPEHWSGCSRRCGHPSGRYLDVLATADGYVRTEVSTVSPAGTTTEQ